jgi:glucosamine--fructose-6-phosphate aminotransferase (isomerizing)
MVVTCTSSTPPPVSGSRPDPAGARFRAEIVEQPDALLRLLDDTRPIAAAARAIGRQSPPYVRLAGHGSSDNAATYGTYAFGLLAGMPAFRASISLSVYYEADEATAVPVVALSQSGRTPDVVEYVERARRRGALTIAVTNEPASELAGAAEIVVPLGAGPERAVAATKTYVNQLGALALLSGAIGGREGEIADGLRRTAELLAGAVDTLAEPAVDAARPLAFAGRLFAVGRGVEFATAREVAVKLTETCRIAAEPLTTTDLAHGPVAALDPLFPVWAVATRDPCLPTVLEAAKRVRAAGAFLISAGDAAADVEGAAVALQLPVAPIPVLSPVLSIIPGQLAAMALAEARGLDPDKPAGLDKVTLAA